jgi:phospholipase C
MENRSFDHYLGDSRTTTDIEQGRPVQEALPHRR